MPGTVGKIDFSACGMRFSGPRKAIYEWLMANPVHPTADTIYQALRSTVLPKLSRTTVYNVLHAFVEHGLVRYVRTEDGESRFDGNVHPHAHFKCECCGKVEDVRLGDLPSPELPSGYRLSQTVLVYRGLCADCVASGRALG